MLGYTHPWSDTGGMSASVHTGIHPPGRQTAPRETPLGAVPRQMVTAADFTHPTGMHSCPWVMYLLSVRIEEAFGFPKPSLFSNYKVMLLLCSLRVN